MNSEYLAKEKNFLSFFGQQGQAALLTTIFVLTISLLIVFTIGFLIINSRKASYNAMKSAQAYYTAEAGIEDTLYRIIAGRNYQDSNSLEVASNTATINITTDGRKKTIKSGGDADSRFRNLQVILNTGGDALTFDFGAQVGEGGIIMSNGCSVSGDIYSNGSITGNNGATIAGSVWVANAPASANQQSVYGDSDFVFGMASPAIDPGQSFIPSITDRLTKVSLYLKKTGSPANRTLRILTDNGNQPSKTLAASGAYDTLTAAEISSDYGWVDVVFDSPPMLQAGVKYWIVIDASANNDNYFFWRKDSSDGYQSNTGMYSPNWNASSPVWQEAGGDLMFKAWMGGTNNSASGLSIGGDVRANTISSCAIGGDAYFQSIFGSTVEGNQYPGSLDPGMKSMPISDDNINEWKSEAEAGGTIEGNYTLSGEETIESLGPKKINGNLTVTNSADLTVTGTLYVTGSINITNTAKVRLGENYGNLSGAVLSDGAISVSNFASFFTNGDGTYLMLLSTAQGTAISVANDADAVIFYATRGTVEISNFATLKAVTAYGLSLANGVQVDYDPELSAIKFSAGAEGEGGWSIADWRETE